MSNVVMTAPDMQSGIQSLLAAAAFTVAAAGGAAAEPVAYEFDRSHTAVRASWSHWGFSRQSIEFTNYDGTLLLDFDNPENSSIDVTFRLENGYWAGAPGDDRFERHLASPDLFDIARFPTIRFRATSFETQDGVTGVMRGELTIRDHTRSVTLDVRLNRREVLSGANHERVGFTATTSIDRSQWGLDFGLPNVCCQVDISIETEFVAPTLAEAQPTP